MIMENKAEPGFFSQVREQLRQIDIKLVPITEHNFERLEPVLTKLGQESNQPPQTGNPEETTLEWVTATKGVWLFGNTDAKDMTEPEVAKGYISVYEPEHLDKINEWLQAKPKPWRPYTKDTLIELSSYATDPPNHADKELAATKMTLGRVFAMDKDKVYGDIQGATLWLTHNSENQLDPFEAAQMKDLGAMALGTLRYDPSENVDSTCFLITKKHFLDTLMGVKKTSPPTPLQ